MTGTSCVFCAIAAGKIPATIVHADQHCVAFADLNPQAPSHTLVIPRRHIALLRDTTAADQELLGQLMSAVVATAARNGLDDYRVVINNGAGAGQTVFHVHVHVLGGRALRWPPG